MNEVMKEAIRTDPNRIIDFGKYATCEDGFHSSKNFAQKIAKRLGVFHLLKRHFKSKERIFQCDLCEHSFTLRNSLSKHRKQFHFL